MPHRPQPERTCVVCRGRGPKRDLMRVVRKPDGQVMVDATGRAPGRGAYVHRREGCLGPKAAHALARALGAPLPAAEAGRLLVESHVMQEAEK